LANNVSLSRIDRGQIAKGILAIAALIGLFLTPLARELAALGVAGLLLLSRRLSSRDMIGAADWHLLLLFVSLFGVTAAFAKTALSLDGLAFLAPTGYCLTDFRAARLTPCDKSGPINRAATVRLKTPIIVDHWGPNSYNHGIDLSEQRPPHYAPRDAAPDRISAGRGACTFRLRQQVRWFSPDNH
jgi:hypothetical protein